MISKKIAGAVGLGATALGAAGSTMTSANLFELMENKEEAQQHLQQTSIVRNFAAAGNIVKRMLEILPNQGKIETIKLLKKIVTNNQEDALSQDEKILPILVENIMNGGNKVIVEITQLFKKILNYCSQCTYRKEVQNEIENKKKIIENIEVKSSNPQEILDLLEWILGMYKDYSNDLVYKTRLKDEYDLLYDTEVAKELYLFIERNYEDENIFKTIKALKENCKENGGKLIIRSDSDLDQSEMTIMNNIDSDPKKVLALVNKLLDTAKSNNIGGLKIIKELIEKTEFEILKDIEGVEGAEGFFKRKFAKGKKLKFKDTEYFQELFKTDNEESKTKFFDSQLEESLIKNYESKTKDLDKFCKLIIEGKGISKEDYLSLSKEDIDFDKNLKKAGIRYEDLVKQGEITDNVKKYMKRYIKEKEKNNINKIYSETAYGRRIVLNKLGYKYGSDSIISKVVEKLSKYSTLGSISTGAKVGAAAGPIGLVAGATIGALSSYVVKLGLIAAGNKLSTHDHVNPQLSGGILPSNDIKKAAIDSTIGLVGYGASEIIDELKHDKEEDIFDLAHNYVVDEVKDEAEDISEDLKEKMEKALNVKKDDNKNNNLNEKIS